MENNYIKGFSKLTKSEKRRMAADLTGSPYEFLSSLCEFDHPDQVTQESFDQFSENTIANFPVPFGVAPNFLINEKWYMVPMVTEESSVVAAASAAAGFWARHGGFKANVSNMLKVGQVHFRWSGKNEELEPAFPGIKNYLMENTREITGRMRERGGGIRDIILKDYTGKIQGYYQLFVLFDTVDSMGANFINTCLEEMGALLKDYPFTQNMKGKDSPTIEIIMAILSNYTPDCLVDCYVETHTSSFDSISGELSGREFALKFCRAVEIADIDNYRAVTHNKGIFNGVDAVVIATGNDFRAVEAAGHAFASRNGNYSSLSYATLNNDIFRFGLSLPLALGTVGGLTRLHPLANQAFKMLGMPSSRDLMMVTAAAGLACNFSAVKSLITSGIQKGHMKMHLGNILSALNASNEQKIKSFDYFADRKVSFDSVKKFLENS